jgi:hypothetical protein
MAQRMHLFHEALNPFTDWSGDLPEAIGTNL